MQKTKQESCCKSGHCGSSLAQVSTHNKATEAKEEAVVLELSSSSGPLKKLMFKIEGMCCASEVEILKEALNPLLRGRDSVRLSFDVINAKITLDSPNNNLPSQDEIKKAVAKTGMKAILWAEHVKQSGNKKTFWQRRGHTIMDIISGLTLVAGFIIHLVSDGLVATLGGEVGKEEEERPENPPIGTMVLYSISIVAGGWFILPKAVRAIKRLRPDTNLLMIIATAGAIAIGHWFEATTTMFLFSFAEFLESWNMARAQRAIRSLMELAPATAQVVDEDGNVSEQRVEDVPIGATIVVRPGEKISMDSELISGSTSVNQAPITGESMPVDKNVGDALFAGTINGDSVIQCRVTKAAADSTLAVIIRKVEEAQSKRAKSDQFIERFSKYYVPFVVISSIIVMVIPPLATHGAWYPWIYKGLELLVLSCPCSLVISTPVSIVAGLTAAARAGVLIKGGVYLETASRIRAFAFDKTGTLTTGEPDVVEIIPFNSQDQRSLLQLAASLEVHSDHPLARAIQKKAKAHGIQFRPAESFQVIKGKGAEGIVGDELYWIGSHRLLHEKVGENEPAPTHEKLEGFESSGHSIVAVGSGSNILGVLCISDSIRPETKKAMLGMKQAGIKKIVMLTGDNKGAAHAIAENAGVDEYYAELLPEDKVKHVKELVGKYKLVAMVGDGINDAPALASSSLGIAMGAAGSDAAIETADIALMSDDLGKLAWLVRHSRRTVNIIIQNIVFSLAIKALFIGLTFANKSTLWMAILIDLGGTFIVVSNGLRLVSLKKKDRRALEAAHTNYNSTLESLPMVPVPSKCKSGCNSAACKKGASKDQHGGNHDVVLVITGTEEGTQKATASKGCCSKGSCKKNAVQEEKKEVQDIPTQQPAAGKGCCSKGSCKKNAVKEGSEEKRDAQEIPTQQSTADKGCCSKKGGCHKNAAKEHAEEKKEVQEIITHQHPATEKGCCSKKEGCHKSADKEQSEVCQSKQDLLIQQTNAGKGCCSKKGGCQKSVSKEPTEEKKCGLEVEVQHSDEHHHDHGHGHSHHHHSHHHDHTHHHHHHEIAC